MIQYTYPADNLEPPDMHCWLNVLRRYFLFSLAANLIWESAHLPLYTLWQEAAFDEIAFAVVHCTGGDLVIAFATLIVALLIVGNRRWPGYSFAPVTAVTLGLGVAYTIFSEWNNVLIRETWAYSDLMPVIPIVEVGLSPLAQWLVIPLVGLVWAQQVVIKGYPV